jgi:hypothetical protein
LGTLAVAYDSGMPARLQAFIMHALQVLSQQRDAGVGLVAG